MNKLILIPFAWILCIEIILVTAYDNSLDEGTDGPWTGRWFPFGPGGVNTDPIIGTEPEGEPLPVPMSMTRMDPSCDNGKINITMDWDGSTWAHTCYMPRSLYRPNPEVSPILKCEHIPAKYSAIHVCMNTSISYDWTIPTYGAHRPVWARYGEYSYVPRQRWLHNLEHGAVVMLYHPCADPQEVARLRRTVRGCLFRHVVTPDRLVSEQRPLVLVSWGCRFEMSYVHLPSVRAFIKGHALRGSEAIARDGLYDEGLLAPASIVSDAEDSDLCPIPTAHM